MSGYRHDPEVVISGKAEVVQSAMPEIVESEISDICTAASCIKGCFYSIDGLTIDKEDPVGMQCPW